MTLERMITTDISANIVQGLLKRRWTLKRIARAIDAPVEFVEGVRAKKHVLTLADIKALAKETGQTAPLMILKCVPNIGSDVRPLFDLTRQSLEASAKLDASLRRPVRKRRGTRSQAA